MVEKWLKQQITIFLLGLPGFCSLASEGIHWSFDAMALFRRYECCVNKYSWMAFELSLLEHKTTACWSFLHSTSHFSLYILGSSETGVIFRATRILYHSTSVRTERSPSASETYRFPQFPKEKERHRSLGFSLCLKWMRKNSVFSCFSCWLLLWWWDWGLEWTSPHCFMPSLPTLPLWYHYPQWHLWP